MSYLLNSSSTIYMYTHYRIQTLVVHVQNNTSIIKQTHNVATPFFPSRPGMKLPKSQQCHAMKIFNRDIQPKESLIQCQTRVGGGGGYWCVRNNVGSKNGGGNIFVLTESQSYNNFFPVIIPMLVNYSFICPYFMCNNKQTS